MFVTSKEKYHKLSVVCVECVALETDHEEADTRVLLATCQICNEHMRTHAFALQCSECWAQRTCSL